MKKSLRSDAKANREVILQSIREIENEFPLKHWGPKEIEKKLRAHKNNLAYRRILSHLKDLKKKGIIERIGRGRYYSKNAIFWRKTIQRIPIREVHETVPKLEGKAFTDFVSKHFPTFNELEREYQRKRRNPFLRLQYNRKLKSLQRHRELANPHIIGQIHKDLKFIEKATEITVLSSKKLPLLNIYDIKASFARVLYYLFVHERIIAKTNGQKSSLENFGLNIIITFDPKKAGVIPSQPKLEELIAEFEKFPLMAEIVGLNREKIESLKRLVREEKELN